VCSSDLELKLEQTRHDFLFGANIFMLGGFSTPEQNKKYESAYLSLFNYATVPFYWSDLEPEPGKPRFAKNSPQIYRRPPPDEVVEFCRRHDLDMKGHPLVWHQWYPKWRPDDSEEAMQRVEKRIVEIAFRYGKTINRWEVVNEPTERYHYADQWFNLPDDYLLRSFKAAAKAFPKDDQMLINEATAGSWLKFSGNSSPYYKLIQGLLDSGAKVDEIGMQLHCFTEKAWQPVMDGQQFTPSELFKVLDFYSNFGRPIAITELTLPTLPNSPEGERIQAIVARNFYRLWFSHPNINAISWWNLVDGTAAKGEDKMNAGLLHNDFSPKPAFIALNDLIRKEWWTNIKQNTGSNTNISVNCFYGDYDLTATYAGKTVKRKIHLVKKGINIFDIQFQ
jgi:endo-1,4-beta-xylanase